LGPVVLKLDISPLDFHLFEALFPLHTLSIVFFDLFAFLDCVFFIFFVLLWLHLFDACFVVGADQQDFFHYACVGAVFAQLFLTLLLAQALAAAHRTFERRIRPQ
jgi:uncharacterized membrane protein